MKRYPNICSILQLAWVAACLGLPPAALAAQVQLATSPLATSTTSSVRPNLMFVLDDSGSMDWTYMPDKANDFNGAYGYASSQCNGVYFDPSQPYPPPVDSTGTSYTNATFTNAWQDGYQQSLGTTNLDNNFQPTSSYAAASAFYYQYLTANTSPVGTGTQTQAYQQNYYNTAGTFYKECISTIGNAPGNAVFAKRRLATTETATVIIAAPGSPTATSVSSIKVNGTELMSGVSASSTSPSTLATSLVAKITLSGYSATCPGYPTCTSGIITITGPTSAADYTPVITKTGNLTLTPDIFPDTNTVNLQKFANWYSYYRTRMLMMKTSTGRAFSAVDDKYRVGYMTINNNNYVSSPPTPSSADFLDIAPFDAAQKIAWYAKLYNANPGNSTPLRESLSKVGRYYAAQYSPTITYTATITVSGSNSTSVSSIKVNGVELMPATSVASTNSGTVAKNIASQINALSPSDFGAAVSGNTITITGPDTAMGYAPVITKSGTMTLNTTVFVSTSVGASLNGVSPKDPMEYSCQQNFTILSTDGFWNGNAGYQLDGVTPVGNQDGNAARPMNDGGTATQTLATLLWQTKQQVTTGPLQFTTKQQATTGTLTWQTKQQAATGALQFTTKQQATTAPLTWSTKQQAATGPLQWTTKQQATTGTLTWQTKQQAATGPLQFTTKQQATTAPLTWQTKQQAATGPLQWTTKQQATTGTLTWQTKQQAATGPLQWTTKQQATSATLTWQTKQQAATGPLQWTTKQQATSATLTWQTKQQAATGALQWTTKQQATSATLTWSTKVQRTSGTMQQKIGSGSWTNVTTPGQTCTPGGSGSSQVQCRVNPAASTGYAPYTVPTCAVSYNSSGTSTVDADGQVTTACPALSGSFGGTTSLTAGQTCTGGGNVQCGTTAAGAATYVTTYPGSCTVSYNGASSTSTADATTGKVITACSLNAAYNPTLTSIGANGICNGTIANLQCSNAGSAAYTTYASPGCSTTFNGAAASSTADASGNVVTCSVNASFGPTTNLTAGQTCAGGGNVQCGTTAAGAATYVTTYPGSCTVSFNGASGTSTADATTGKVITACSLNAAYNPTLTSIGANGICNGTIANLQCSNAGSAAYTTYASPGCSTTFNGAAASSTADGSGNVVTCSVSASFGPTTSLTAGQTCTGGGNVQCGTTAAGAATYVTTYPGSCTVSFNGASGTSTADATTGKVITACSLNAAYNPTLTSIGANGICNGTIANLQCSNAGSAAYTTYASPGCSTTFNGAAASSTADGSGNVVTCSVNASFGPTTNLTASQTCTGGGNVQCGMASAATAYVTTYPGTCTVTYNGSAATSTADGSGKVTSCPVNAAFNPVLTSVGANGSCNGALANIQCSNSATPVYTTYASPNCTSSFNAAGTSTADIGGNVVTCSVNASYSPTTNLTAGQTCAGGGNVQCGTGTTSTAYVTTYPGTCSITYNGAAATSTANSSGQVVTACPLNAAYNPALTSVGANATCNGALANIQCSNAGTPVYTTYASPNCTSSFNAAGTSTADIGGNVVTCSVNASYSPTTSLTAGQTCTGGGNIQCGMASATTAYVTTYPGTCTVTYNGSAATSTADGTGKVTSCSVNAAYNPVLTSVGANATCNGGLANIQCSNAGTPVYTTYAAPNCTSSFNGASGTSTADIGGNVVTCSVSGSYSTPTNLASGQSCTGGGNVQCGIGATSTAYVTAYPGTCAVTYNGAAATSTADSGGLVVTACPLNAAYNPTKTSVGANASCNGALANIQCSNAGTPVYTTFAAPNCTTSFNAAGTSTADIGGNVVTCSVSGSYSTATSLTAGQTCAGGGNVQCGTSGATTAYVTTYPGTCAVTYNGAGATSTADGSGKIVTACPVNASYNPTKTSVGPNATCNGALANIQCSNGGTAAYTTFASPNCTTTFNGTAASSTADASGNVNTCSVNASYSPTTSLTAGQTCVGGGNVQCTTGTGSLASVVPPATCSISYNGALGTTTVDPVTSKVVTACGTTGGTSDTLSDVAMYYYQTDLRTVALNNCTSGSTGNTLCAPPVAPKTTDDYNNVFPSALDTNNTQHMTTFTLGLGARGRMVYSTYEYMTKETSDTGGDFYSVRVGSTANSSPTPPICSWQANNTTCNWPIPASNAIENIDDLWHAAVNGRGTYFSATNPATLASGLSQALASIKSRKGAAAAAATSTLNPVAGNNLAYVASYTTAKWIGNLEARTIDVDSGVISPSATWCVEDLTVPPAPTACTGTLKIQVAKGTRKILTPDSAGSTLVDFTYANLDATNQSYFNSPHINSLSQWSLLSDTQKGTAAGANLVDFLRGNTTYADNVIYRSREAVLGDALESQPAYLGKPVFSYSDKGYADFKAAQSAKSVVANGMVYMGANDGMLHAFYAKDAISYTDPNKCIVGAAAGVYCGGEEAWAFVPSILRSRLWILADTNYSVNHANFVNGSPVTTDVCVAHCLDSDSQAADWRTIVVGGLNGGGREYYALDITDPPNPKLLWEFTPAKNTNLGYSFGVPVVTKKADGTWVVLVTSGYDNGTLDSNGVTNNSPAGNGQGYLYVLAVSDGHIISTIGTGAGSNSTPSGLAKIATWNNAAAGIGNLAEYTYGGDLQGNVWRFDINSAAATGVNPLLFAVLKDPSGSTQPITTAPVLGNVSGKHIIYVGTGKYLENSDLGNSQVQSLYALKDDGDNASTKLTNPGGSPRNSTTLVKQTIISAGTTRTASNNPVNFGTGLGWYIDFPDGGERVNIDSKLIQGTLIVPTIVPSNTACAPGGYGWLNYFNYETGSAVKQTVSQIFDSPIVGFNVIYIKGDPIIEVVTSSDPTPKIPGQGLDFTGASGGFTSHRVIWRELIQ